jgi:hypothetical protein
MVDCQLWSRVGYDICNNTTLWGDLEGCMQRVHWQLIAQGLIRRSALVALYQLETGDSMALDAHTLE